MGWVETIQSYIVFLDQNPDEMARVKTMNAEQVSAAAAEKGFDFTPDELVRFLESIQRAGGV